MDTGRACVICGAGIGHRHLRAIVCGEVCARKRQQQAVLRYRAANKTAHSQQRKAARQRRKFFRSCLICGASLAECHGLAKTCGPECRTEHEKQVRKTTVTRQREQARERYATRRDDPAFKEYRSRKEAQRRARLNERDREAYLERKRQDYERNRERYLAQQKARRDSNLEAHRAASRQRHEDRRAALILLREIKSKGLEVVL